MIKRLVWKAMAYLSKILPRRGKTPGIESAWGPSARTPTDYPSGGSYYRWKCRTCGVPVQVDGEVAQKNPKLMFLVETESCPKHAPKRRPIPESWLAKEGEPLEGQQIAVMVGRKRVRCELVSRNAHSVVVKLPDGNVITKKNRYVVQPQEV